MVFEFYQQIYVEKVHWKLNLAQSTKQKSPKNVIAVSDTAWHGNLEMPLARSILRGL